MNSPLPSRLCGPASALVALRVAHTGKDSLGNKLRCAPGKSVDCQRQRARWPAGRNGRNKKTGADAPGKLLQLDFATIYRQREKAAWRLPRRSGYRRGRRAAFNVTRCGSSHQAAAESVFFTASSCPKRSSAIRSATCAVVSPVSSARWKISCMVSAIRSMCSWTCAGS